MGLFDGLRRKKRPPAFEVDSAAVADSILHPSSFSLVVFWGEHGDRMHDFLASCDYVVIREGAAHGTPVELYDALGGVVGTNKAVVLKAYWSSPAMTVLHDPEMVLSAGSEAQVAAFCAAQDTQAIGVLWERVSESAILTEITAGGVARQTWFERGQPFDHQVDPRPEVECSPDADGLRAALAACGVPVDRLFADVDVTVLELQE